MKLKTLVNSIESLNELVNLNLPIKVSYKISKIAKKVGDEVSLYEKKRNEIVKELGKEDENTKITTVLPENMDKYTTQVTELQDVDTDIEFGGDKPFQKIALDEFGDIKVEPKNLIALDWLIE